MASHNLHASKLDLFLGAKMRPSTDLAARLADAEVDLRAMVNVAREADVHVFADIRSVKPAAIVTFFGEPLRADPGRLVYELNLWPDHFCEWNINQWEQVSHEGFSLREPPAISRSTERTVRSAQNTFWLFHSTRHEVARYFGAPDLDLSWYPQEGWHYGPDFNDHDLIFDFDFGLLRAITSEQSVVAAHKKRSS